MIAAALLVSLTILAANASEPAIDVVYPRPAKQDTIARIDRVNYNFIFGSVRPAQAELTINNTPVPVEKSGAFLAYLPVDWVSQTYRLEARIDSLTVIEKIVSFTDRDVMPNYERPDKKIEFPVQLTLSGGVARSHPEGVYYLFPFSGTKVEAVDIIGGHYKVPLSPERSVWIAEKHVEAVSPSKDNAMPIVWKAVVQETPHGDELVIPLGSKPLYRVLPAVDKTVLTIEIYGVITHIDIISYQNPSRLIREVQWEVPSDNVLRLMVKLSSSLWGYKVRYEGNSLKLLVRKPPKIKRGVKGLTIALDPGHGGESYGSIGPLRSAEKEINLKVALELGEILRSKGAVVMISRSTDISIGLLERIKMAEEAEADLLISLHHNALGDGIDPFSYFGTGTHYYNSHSRGLAESVQHAVHRELHLYDEGVYYNNLAMVRPTYMPAVLVEAAYMIIPEHEQMMMQDKYSGRLARAVYKGLISYLKDERRRRLKSRSSSGTKLYSPDIFDD